MKGQTGKRGKRYASEYIRIFMLFFTFFIVFGVVSFFIYWRADAEQREQIRMDTAAALSASLQETDSLIQQIYELSYQFLSNDYVTRLFPSSDKEYTREEALNTISLVRFIRNFRYSLSNDIYHVTLYSDGDNLFNDAGMYDFDLYFSTLYRHRDNDADFWRETVRQSSRMIALPVDEVSEKYGAIAPRSVLPFAVSKQVGEKRWALVTELNAAWFENTMGKNQVLEGQLFYCVDRDGKTILNTTGHLFTEQENAALFQLASGQRVIGEERYSLAGEICSLAAGKGLEGIRFFVFTPQRLLSLAAYTQNQTMLFFFLLTMVLFFVLTLFFTHRLYHPMNSLIQFVNGLSGGDMPTRNLHGVRFPQLGQLDERYHRREEALIESLNDGLCALLFEGKGVGYPRLQRRFLQIAGLSDQAFCCLALQLEFYDCYYEAFTEEEQRTVDDSLALILSGTLNQYFHCYLMEYDRGGFLCFYNGRERPAKWNAALQAVADLLSYDADYCRLTGGISLPHSEDAVLYDSMMEAVTALGFSGGDGSEAFHPYNPQEVSFTMQYSSKERNKLLNLLKSGEKEKALQLVGELVRVNRENHLHQSLMQMLLRSLYDVGCEYQEGAATEGNRLWDIVSQVEKGSHTVPRACRGGAEWLKSFLARSLDAIHPAESAPNSLEYVFQYITNHFAEDLYLERIAEQVHMSPKYLSRSFKEKTGVNITEYISLARITKAKELLTETELNIAGIGEAVGFENRTTFFRTFKKLEGVSPNEYRKANQSK